MDTSEFLLYLATWSLVSLMPGPAVMCSMAQVTRHGFQSSLAGICGLQIGNCLFFVCASLGLGALLAAASTVFNLLRVLGAIYLFYLGIRIFQSTLHRSTMVTSRPVNSPAGFRSLFLQGMIIQLANPKALLFFSALLPQFIDPARPVPFQFKILLLTTLMVDAVVLSSYAFLAERGARAFRRSSVSMWLERIFAAALMLFGARLLLSRS